MAVVALVVHHDRPEAAEVTLELAERLTDAGHQALQDRQEREQRMADREAATWAQSKDEVYSCHCGCGDITKNMFAVGHDARYAGIVGRRVAEMAPATADAPWLNAEVSRNMIGCSDALTLKAIRVAINHRAKLAKRAS